MDMISVAKGTKKFNITIYFPKIYNKIQYVQYNGHFHTKGVFHKRMNIIQISMLEKLVMHTGFHKKPVGEF